MKKMTKGRALFSILYFSLIVLLCYLYNGFKNYDFDKPIEPKDTHRLRERGEQLEIVETKKLPANILGSDDRLSTENQKKIYAYCDSIGVDGNFIITIALTISNGDMKDLFNLGLDRNKSFTYVEQISAFLIKSGLVKTNRSIILFENQKLRLEKSYIKAFTDLYGKQKLTRLYNNYYIITNKHIE